MKGAIGSADRERGAGSVVALAVCAVLVTGALAIGALAQAVVARHTVSSAADLAALAAADRLAVGGGDVCAVAARVLAAQGSDLTGCRVQPDGSVVVEASREVASSSAGWGPARASARAGPAP